MGTDKSLIHLVKGKEFGKIFNDSNTYFSLNDFFLNDSFESRKNPKCFVHLPSARYFHCRIVWAIFLPGKQQLCSLLFWIRVELHLPLISPLIYMFNLSAGIAGSFITGSFITEESTIINKNFHIRFIISFKIIVINEK